MIRILDDDTPINCIHFDEAKWSVCLNKNGITKIEAYGETGEMAEVPWIAIWRGTEILYRFPAHSCRIEYAQRISKSPIKEMAFSMPEGAM